MRFSAAIKSPAPLRNASAADLMRRLVSMPVAQLKPAPAPAERDPLPADLDQRVRLVGEW